MAAKQKENGLLWDFPSTNHGEEHGFSDSLLEYFQGDHEKYVARETIQNAVDARDDYEKPVSVVFEHFTIPVSSLPGRAILLDRMNRCLAFVKNQEKAEDFFQSAIELLKGPELPILKISDFNTVGLSGSDNEREKNWYRLVRAAGTSTPKGVAGGTFGIGKGAPIAASQLRMVFYSSMNDKNESVFQGKARLVSHYNDSNDVCQGIGFYGINGYQAVRHIDLIPDLFRRQKRGTDIFVIGYKTCQDWQEKLIASVLQNFWLAILHGNLEVAVQGGSEKNITKDTLRECLHEYGTEDAGAYFGSVTNCTEKFEEELKHLGKVSLFVRKQDNYPGKIMMVRKPKMLVQERGYRVLREPYAGVLICDDDRGNRFLRNLEPPAHDKWDRDRAKNGTATLLELDDFVKRALKSMGETVTGEPQDIPGLDRYLPDSEDRDYPLQKEATPLAQTELSGNKETGREIGAAKESIPSEVEPALRRTVVVRTPAIGHGPEKGGGKGGGGGGSGGGRGGGGEEGEKEEGARIRTANISFRSFVQNTKDGLEYHFVITGREKCSGAICLVAVGDDGSYPADLKSAVETSSGKHYEVSNSMIKNLLIESGETIKLAVKLASKKKYAIGIENYEG